MQSVYSTAPPDCYELLETFEVYENNDYYQMEIISWNRITINIR